MVNEGNASVMDPRPNRKPLEKCSLQQQCKNFGFPEVPFMVNTWYFFLLLSMYLGVLR